MILETLNYPPRQVELAKIAGFLHDIGNVINRNDHAQSGAVMAFRLLDRLEMPVDEICSIISAIGNHDEGTAQPVDAISAALIIADKTDVRRSRVRNTDFMTFDIHDRVNYAVEYSNLHFSEDKKSLVLDLTIDTEISSVLEYFEISWNACCFPSVLPCSLIKSSRCTSTAAVFCKDNSAGSQRYCHKFPKPMHDFGENNGGTIS